MKFKFEDLIIWQRAMTFGEEIFSQTQKFPKDELYGLTSQIRRAGDSIALNISEGAIEQTGLEFGRFMSYAIRSLAEVVTCLYKALNRKYITKVVFDKLYEDAFNLMNMMIAFRKKVKGTGS